MLRNKEIQQLTIILIIIAVTASLIGFRISGETGILIILLSAAFGTAFFIFTYQRYMRLKKMAEEIDQVLHYAEHLFIQEEEEGELSILQSEISKMVSRLREQNTALKQEKENLSDSLADIAHQLRTPLTSVTLIVSLLRDTREEQEKLSLLREMDELLVRMDWLITSLLKLSRLNAGIVSFQSEQVDVKTLVQTALRPFSIAMDLHDITTDIIIPENMTVCGDQGWLCEAIQNIIKNSMESTGEHGKIEIEGRDNPLFSEIHIHDYGAGFRKEDIPKLFDRFYRGQNTQTAGFGIGLALCKTIIIRMGGTITAKNHPSGGALFVIHFPK